MVIARIIDWKFSSVFESITLYLITVSSIYIAIFNQCFRKAMTEQPIKKAELIILLVK